MQRRKFTREFKLEAVRLIRDRGIGGPGIGRSGRASVATAGCVKKFAADPQYAFPGNGQMKPEQLETV